MTRQEAAEKIIVSTDQQIMPRYAVVPREECRGTGSWNDAPYQLAEFSESAGGYIGFWGLPGKVSLLDALLDYDDVVELAETLA